MFNFPKTPIAKLILSAFVLSVILVIVSSYMRLSNQGLGCNNWPECYGLIDISKLQTEINITQITNTQSRIPSKYIPHTPVEQLHRIIASLLLLNVLAICIVSWRQKSLLPHTMTLPLSLLVLCLGLAILGIVYGTPLLRPIVVSANLLGGMAMMAVLWWMILIHNTDTKRPFLIKRSLRILVLLGLGILFTQTALGGWVSSNFAALACDGFPQCNGNWIPEMNIKQGFKYKPTLNIGLDNRISIEKSEQVGIAVTHRVFAVFTIIIIGWLCVAGIKIGGIFRTTSQVILILLLMQIVLGIAVVFLKSPLLLVVLHNAFAAFLWMSVLFLLFNASQKHNNVRI